MKKLIYLDNAATTKTAPEVVEAMLPYFTEYYGNPSSVYEFAGKSKQAVDAAREKPSQSLWAQSRKRSILPQAVRESDNWALKATAEAYAGKGKTHHHHEDRASRHPSHLRVSGETRF